MEGDEDKIGAAFDTFGGNVKDAMGAVLDDSKRQMQQLVSVPVGSAATGGVPLTRGGLKPFRKGQSKIIRSRPGDPPRKETGELFNSFFTQTAQQGGNVEGLLFSVSRTERGDAQKDVYLEYGTSKMAPRPHWARMIEFWQATFEQRLATEIKERQ